MTEYAVLKIAWQNRFTNIICTTLETWLASFLSIQVAEKILNGKELEFYKWEGELSQLLQNVREKLNRVAEVIFFDLYNFFNIVPYSRILAFLVQKSNKIR